MGTDVSPTERRLKLRDAHMLWCLGQARDNLGAEADEDDLYDEQMDIFYGTWPTVAGKHLA